MASIDGSTGHAIFCPTNIPAMFSGSSTLYLLISWMFHKHRLYTKTKKCEFHTDLTEYLRYYLSPSRLTMSKEKVQAIQDWP